MSNSVNVNFAVAKYSSSASFEPVVIRFKVHRWLHYFIWACNVRQHKPLYTLLWYYVSLCFSNLLKNLTFSERFVRLLTWQKPYYTQIFAAVTALDIAIYLHHGWGCCDSIVWMQVWVEPKLPDICMFVRRITLLICV